MVFVKMKKPWRRVMSSSDTRQIYKNDFTEYLLCLALDVGEGMLKNGGDVNRVEDTIERICRAYGAEHVEVFTIISVINAAIRMPDGTYSSQLRRVKSTSNNLGKLEALNALSREICRDKPSLSEFDDKLHHLKKTPEYPRWAIILASAVASGAFTLIFGGGALDAVAAMLIGVIISLIENFSPKKLNVMARIVLSSLVATLISGIMVSTLQIASSHDAIMSGVIMLLVPGLAFGTAMRDLFYGDLIAGSLKTLQAILLSLMIAFGYVLGMSALGGSVLPCDPIKHGAVTEFAMAFVASVSFAVLFRVNKRHLLFAGIGSLLTYAIYYFLLECSADLFTAAIVSSIFTAAYAEICARGRKAPTIVFLLTGVIPTVPGRYLYNTMRYLLEQKWDLALDSFLDTMKIALGIAAGVVFVAMLWSILYERVKSLALPLIKKLRSSPKK